MKKLSPLLPGEKALPQAPWIVLDDREYCVPQHYLSYHHSRESVESIVMDIDYSNRFILFVGAEADQLYLQVGVVGFDNYKAINSQQARKLVYGRKWRVEPNLPSSEIIQTAFLAFKKAREHEVRELFRVHNNGSTFTPFNGHHDLPLMARNAEMFAAESTQLNKKQLIELMANITYDEGLLTLLNLEKRHENQWLIDFSITPTKHSQLDEICHRADTLVVRDLTLNAVLHGLMDKFLHWSDKHVEENFLYKGFARFSRNTNPLEIGLLSVKTRRRESNEGTDAFTSHFNQANYETDKSRIPSFSDSPLAQKILNSLSSLNIAPQYLEDLLAD